MLWVSDAWSSQNILLYSKAKDKPALLGALATKSDFLLTMDRVDFEGKTRKAVLRDEHQNSGRLVGGDGRPGKNIDLPRHAPTGSSP